jgi:hypothetical protein
MRDRIRLGLGGLKAFGEVWGTSRRTERETKRIARSVFASGNGSGSGTPEMGEMNFVEQVDLSGGVDGIGGMEMGWQDLREMEYLAMLDGMGQQRLNGIST